MITYIIFLIIFKQIFGYNYYFHILSNYDTKLYINNNLRYTIYQKNVEIIIPIMGGSLKEVINSKIRSDYCSSCTSNYENKIYGYIELENNCTLLFTNNSLINVHKYYWETKLLENVNCICYELFNNEQYNKKLVLNFTLWKVPKNCHKNIPLTDLTYNFDDGFHKYNDIILIQTEKLIKFKENYSYLNYKLFLYVEENDDSNYKLYNENDEELFLNKPIKFRILKIKNFGENYSHRKIKINFYTVDALLNPKSSLSSITFELCGYGCKCSSSDSVNNYCNECLENFAYLEDERDFCQEIEKLKSPYFIHNKEKNSFIHCIFPCKTCENEVDNCTSCADEYNTIKNQTTGKIIKCCPINFNYLIEFSKECTFECNKQIEYKYYDEKEFNCFKSCKNDNNKYNYNDYLCVEKCPNYSFVIENEKKCIFDLKIINDYENYLTTSMKIDELYEKLDSYY